MENQNVNSATLKNVTNDEAGKKFMQAVFMAEANAKTVKEMLQPIQEEICNFFKFQPTEEAKKMGIMKNSNYWNGEHLTKRGLFLASPEDWKLFDQEFRKKFEELGFKAKPECCPILEAEYLEREVTRHAVEYFAPMFGIEAENLFYSLKHYNTFVDLIKRMFAPLMDTKEIMDKLK